MGRKIVFEILVVVSLVVCVWRGGRVEGFEGREMGCRDIGRIEFLRKVYRNIYVDFMGFVDGRYSGVVFICYRF